MHPTHIFRVRFRAAAYLCLASCLCLFLAGCGSKKHVPLLTAPKIRNSHQSTLCPDSSGTTQRHVQAPTPSGGRPTTRCSLVDGYEETGIASWYGRKFHGRRTANGEIYNMYSYTAAHRILPMKTKLVVENLENGSTVNVTVNDRGPFVDTDKRIIDLSYAAAKALGMDTKGLARVRIHSLGKVEGVHDGDLSGTFYVQLGAFTQKANARALADKLKARGYSGTRLEQADIDGRTFWRVQAGIFTSYSKAQSNKERLAHDHPGAFVVAR